MLLAPDATSHVRALIGVPTKLGLSSSSRHSVDVLKGVMYTQQPAGSSLGQLHQSVASLQTQMNVQVCPRKQQNASLVSALYAWYAQNNVPDKHMLAGKVGAKAEPGTTQLQT